MPLRNVTPIPRRPWGKMKEGDKDNSDQDIPVIVQKILDGKLNCTANIILAVGPATVTVFEDTRITGKSVVLWSPKTNNARLLPILYFVAELGKVTFHHAADAAVDREFGIVVLA